MKYCQKYPLNADTPSLTIQVPGTLPGAFLLSVGQNLLMIGLPAGDIQGAVRGRRRTSLFFDRFKSQFPTLLQHQGISFVVIVLNDPVKNGFFYEILNDPDRF